ncbi:MAG: MFS transporter [Dehalococcoidia bacterium]
MTGRPFYFLVAALWLGNLIPALDATLVGTALPTVIGALDGLSLYSWVFASYLLTLTIAIPIFGKLADLFGRKPVYFFGMGLFTVAAVLSALVQNVEQLIVCRILIGLATACVQPVAQTIMGDAFPMAQRAKLQWMFASAWFVASAIGPIIATAITFYLSWRLVFLVTVPLGLCASFLMATKYHESVERKSHRIDFAGVFLLGAGVLALLFALSPTNRTAGVSTQSLGLIAIAGVLLVLFVWNETRAAEPVLPPRLFLIPVLGIAALGSVASGIVQSGATSFIPIFVQGAQGGTAADVAMVLPLMTIGWPIGAGIGGRFLLRVGFRRSAIAGMALTAVAQAGFLLLGRDSSTFFAAACMTLMGLGFGFSSVGFMISVQNSVGWRDRGVATASLQFFRSIGGSVGVAIMGTIMGLRMQPLIERYQVTGTTGAASALLDPSARGALAPDVLAALQLGMTEAVHSTFWVMAIASVAGLVAVLWFPRTLREVPDATSPAPSSAPARDEVAARE